MLTCVITDITLYVYMELINLNEYFHDTFFKE